MAVSDSKIIYFPIPHFMYALITKQVRNQMFFRAWRNFQIFRAQIVLFLMIKPNTSEGNISKLRFLDSFKLFLRKKTFIKAGNILSFLGSSVTSEPCQTYEMERSANLLTLWKTLHLRYLTGVWIHLVSETYPSLHFLLLSKSLARRCNPVVVVPNFKGLNIVF